jgi:uncharacterized protein
MGKSDTHRMQPSENKFDLLLHSLRPHLRIAIAFSGGVDSTLLLHAALIALGPKNVMALYARSTLNSAASIAGSSMVFARNFPHASAMREIQVAPLSWPEFIVNDTNRCYYCKKRMYTLLQEAMQVAGYTTLADGTNIGDQQDGRPGLRAINELQVITPLADVGLIKSEVRRLAEKFGLSNHDLPSNSCLATRISHNTPIAEKTLRVIELAEVFLHDHGFVGCRVRVQDSCTLVEVREQDVSAFVEPANRTRVHSYFHNLQLAPVVLSLKGR